MTFRRNKKEQPKIKIHGTSPLALVPCVCVLVNTRPHMPDPFRLRHSHESMDCPGCQEENGVKVPAALSGGDGRLAVEDVTPAGKFCKVLNEYLGGMGSPA